MIRNPLRWADPATVGAYYDMRDLAPRLSGLIYSAAMPEKPLAAVLHWSEALMELDAGPAFDLDRLREVMPALVVAFVASHTYAHQRRRDGEGDVIELYDAGCGTLVCKVMGLTAMALHGDQGRTLVEATRDDLSGKLRRISEMISGQ